MCKATYCATFDDGKIEFYELGIYLSNHNVRGTFYVVPSLIGKCGYMGLSHLHELNKYGHLIANHGWMHRFWQREHCSISEIQTDITKASQWFYSHGFEDGARMWAIAGGTSQWELGMAHVFLGSYVDQIRLTNRNPKSYDNASGLIYTDAFDDSKNATVSLYNAIKYGKLTVSGFHSQGLIGFEAHIKEVIDAFNNGKIRIATMNELYVEKLDE